MSINEEVCGKSRGRPKQFDRDRALESALSICSGGTVMKPPRWPIWWK